MNKLRTSPAIKALAAFLAFAVVRVSLAEPVQVAQAGIKTDVVAIDGLSVQVGLPPELLEVLRSSEKPRPVTRVSPMILDDAGRARAVVRPTAEPPKPSPVVLQLSSDMGNNVGIDVNSASKYVEDSGWPWYGKVIAGVCIAAAAGGLLYLILDQANGSHDHDSSRNIHIDGDHNEVTFDSSHDSTSNTSNHGYW